MRVGALEQLDAEVDDVALPEVVGELDHQVADVRLDVAGRGQVDLRGGHVAMMPGQSDVPGRLGSGNTHLTSDYLPSQVRNSLVNQ